MSITASMCTWTGVCMCDVWGCGVMVMVGGGGGGGGWWKVMVVVMVVLMVVVLVVVVAKWEAFVVGWRVCCIILGSNSWLIFYL